MTDLVASIEVKLLDERARVPERAYDHDAAFDLFAIGDHVVPAQCRALVGTGIALGLPTGMAALTLPRSGLAIKHGVSLVNSPGLIDPGYRGEIRLIVLNTDTAEDFHIAAGDRIAQLLFISLTPIRLALVTELTETHRGERGFGSSGVKAGER